MNDGSRRTVLVTGAAGRLGRALAEDLGGSYGLRLLDRTATADLPGLLVGDVADAAALDAAMAGVDAVVHLAGNPSPKATYAELRSPNLDGTAEVLAAAVRHGVRRVVLASSNRVVEAASPLRRPGHERPLTPDDPVAPDSPYGASKAFGEALASYHAHAHGLSTVSLRLGSVDTGVEPSFEDKPRAWALWLSRRDLVGLVRASIEADVDGHTVVFASSANTRRWWDLSAAADLLGYAPVDDSERLLHDRHAGALVAPAVPYPLPWGERLAALRPEPDRAFLVALGQSGFWLATAGVRLAVDPFLTVYPDRLQPPLLDAADLPVDHVLVTHTHRDHLDAPALSALAAADPAVRFVGPPTVRARLAELGIESDRLTTLLPGERTACGDVEVLAVPARHRPTTPDAQGYLLTTPTWRVFHTGDTELDPCLDDAGPHRPDVLVVPINGRKGNMTAEQAAELTARLGVPVVIPMHYGCLQPVDDLLDRFLGARAELAPSSRVALMDPGSIARLPFPAAP